MRIHAPRTKTVVVDSHTARRHRMGRQKGGLEGSVRQNPPGSGIWQGRLPKRVDLHRRPIPGTFDSAAACRRALNEAIADIDRGRKRKPVGKESRLRRSAGAQGSSTRTAPWRPPLQ